MNPRPNAGAYHITKLESYMRYICPVNVVAIWSTLEVFLANPVRLQKNSMMEVGHAVKLVRN